jgi:hypothetical protein
MDRYAQGTAMSDAKPLSQVSQSILTYLQQHPDAADTADGIACWWLPEGLRGDVNLVAQALEDLLSTGRIRRVVNADRHMIYFAAKRRQDDCA